MPVVQKRRVNCDRQTRHGPRVPAVSGNRGRQKPLRTKYSTFVHDALEDAENQIRLLRILFTGHLDSPLELELATWNLDDAPPYEAISYAWGDTSEKAVYCNGRVLRVRSNCHYALSQVRRYHRSRNSAEDTYIWMDSICIDQANLQEKGHQVRRMYQIYRKATKVLACVGRAEMNSDEVISMANETRSWEMVCDPPDKNLTALPETRIARLHDALHFFSNRPYWSRFWILQELLAASKDNAIDTDVDILCGDQSASLKDVHSVVTLLREANAHDDYRWHAKYYGRKSSTPLTTILHHSYLLKFADVFTLFDDFECFDARDRVYALLHLANMPPDLARTIPDYTISAWELAQNISPYLDISQISNLLRTLRIDSATPELRDATSARLQRIAPAVDPPTSSPMIVQTQHLASSEQLLLERDRIDLTSERLEIHNQKLQNSSHPATLRCLRIHDEALKPLHDIPEALELCYTMSTAKYCTRASASDSAKQLDALLDHYPPLVVFAGIRMIAIVCNDTRPNDILVTFQRRNYDHVLVVRQNDPGLYAAPLNIVGQGFIIPTCGNYLTAGGDDDVSLQLSPEDTLTFFGQDIIGKSEIDTRVCLFRLFTKVSLDPDATATFQPDYDFDWRDLYSQPSEDPIPDGLAEQLTEDGRTHSGDGHSCWSGCEWDGMKMVHYRKDEDAIVEDEERTDESEDDDEDEQMDDWYGMS